MKCGTSLLGPARRLHRPPADGGEDEGGSPVTLTPNDNAGNTKGGSITVPLTSCLTGLELVV
jgi:hypothetical protein